MYELNRTTQFTAGLTGLVVAMGAAPFQPVTVNEMTISQNITANHRWTDLFVDISIPEGRQSWDHVGKDRAQALHDLFQWIDTLPPVPSVDLGAMDRGEIY